LEGAAENIMFGGAATYAGNVPSDIEVLNNVITKPLSWRLGDPSYGGYHFSVKNLFEIKNGQRLLVEGNLIQYVWADGQGGASILFTPRTAGGSNPWVFVGDITFRNNILQHAAGVFVITGHDDDGSSVLSARILIKNNLFLDIAGTTWNGSGRFMQVTAATDVTVENNLSVNSGTNILHVGTGKSEPNLTWRDNVHYGNLGCDDGHAVNTVVSTHFPSSTISGNVFIGGTAANFPAGNYFPANDAAVKFVNAGSGDYHELRLSAASAYRGVGANGTNPGVDFTALDAAFGLSWALPKSRIIGKTRIAGGYAR
jgi:hypothetical protein